MSKCECKECIHNDVCKYEVVHSTKGCEHFKDKSLCVELPVRVGDKIWCKDIYIDESYEIVEKVITSLMLFKDEINFYAAKPSDLAWVTLYDITDFGKTVFTDEAEVERKLEDLGV